MCAYLPMSARLNDKNIICPDTSICITLNTVLDTVTEVY